MSSHQFDPNRITIEDIFRAKEQRRRRLAKLPLEEKMKIVERLKTVPATMMASQPSSFLHNRFVSMIGRPRTHQRITDTLRWMINLTSLILRSKARRKQE